MLMNGILLTNLFLKCAVVVVAQIRYSYGLVPNVYSASLRLRLLDTPFRRKRAEGGGRRKRT